MLDQWITITAGSSGVGSGTVQFGVLANNSPTRRTAEIVIAGQ
jgi:hypothetical protein